MTNSIDAASVATTDDPDCTMATIACTVTPTSKQRANLLEQGVQSPAQKRLAEIGPACLCQRAQRLHDRRNQGGIRVQNLREEREAKGPKDAQRLANRE